MAWVVYETVIICIMVSFTVACSFNNFHTAREVENSPRPLIVSEKDTRGTFSSKLSSQTAAVCCSYIYTCIQHVQARKIVRMRECFVSVHNDMIMTL